jgi:hypothetical protein
MAKKEQHLHAQSPFFPSIKLSELDESLMNSSNIHKNKPLSLAQEKAVRGCANRVLKTPIPSPVSARIRGETKKWIPLKRVPTPKTARS